MQILRGVCVCFVADVLFEAIFDGGCLIWWGWAWLSGMEENKKSLRESRLRAKKKTTPAEFRACNGAEIAP